MCLVTRPYCMKWDNSCRGSDMNRGLWDRVYNAFVSRTGNVIFWNRKTIHATFVVTHRRISFDWYDIRWSPVVGIGEGDCWRWSWVQVVALVNGTYPYNVLNDLRTGVLDFWGNRKVSWPFWLLHVYPTLNKMYVDISLYKFGLKRTSLCLLSNLGSNWRLEIKHETSNVNKLKVRWILNGDVFK